MIRLDTPPDSIDVTYAKSLFGLAESRGGRELLESLASELEELVELARSDPKFEEFLASRIIPAEARAASLGRILKGNVSDEVLHVLLVMNRKGRLSRFARMASAYERLVEERFGRVEVDLFTRFPPPADQLDSIRDQLREALDREPVLYTYTDESMIGGFRIRVGDRLIDGSFATRLRKMRDRLTEHGGDVIRQRYERAYEE